MAKGQRNRDQRTGVAMNEQLAKIVTEMKTAAEMFNEASMKSVTLVTNSAKAQQMVNDLAATLTSALGGNAVGYGGGLNVGVGPNAGRPIMGDNQTRRPSMDGRGIPVPSAHGGTGGGTLGLMRRLAAQSAHQRFGLGQQGAASYSPVYDESGAISHYTAHDVSGQVVRSGLSPMEVMALANRSRIAGSFAEGGIMRAAMSQPELAVPLAVVGGVYEAGKFISSQRSANAQYQSIYGGSNLQGLGQRVHAEGFKARNIWDSVFGGSNVLSQGDADKAFKGVSALGYQGSQRNRSLDFVTSNYKSMGMSVDESLQLVGINAKQASTNLSALHEQLKAVSDMAAQTGQNADLFRQSFIRSYGANVNASIGQGSGALAAAQTAVTAGAGRPYAGLNLSGMYSTTNQMAVLAAQQGYQNVGVFEAKAQQNPQFLAKAQEDILNAAFNAVVPQSTKDQIMQLAEKAGGASAVASNVGAQRNIAQQIMLSGAIQPQVLRSALQARNFDTTSLNDQDLYAYMVRWVVMGGHPLTQALAQEQKKTDQQQVNVAGGKHMGPQDIIRSGGSTGLQHGKLVYDPVVAAAIKGLGKNGMVQVQTANGPQVVSIDEAAKNYRDQLTSGSAMIATGEGAGQTIKQVYGSEQSATYDSTVNKHVKLSKTQQMVDKMGLSPEDSARFINDVRTHNFKDLNDLMKGHSGGTSGRVEIGMKPELAKYLNITTSGNAIVEGGAVSGSPPSLPSVAGSASGG